ncbi:MAG: rhodanese-like domain-containing protein [Cellulosilyticum sp.]|nr:rhodanese-like domain-containing protein [Cellulosilyticum sp.]
MRDEVMKEITTEAFVMLIWNHFCQNQETNEIGPAAIMQYGRYNGWLEEADILWANKAIERRVAARIIHQFLRKECREMDEADWNLARQLGDLYDCRTCVNHVAQVFVKGVMGVKSEHKVNEKAMDKKYGTLFGMRDFITYEEAYKIVERMFKKELRIMPGVLEKDLLKTVRLSFEEAMLLVDKKHSLLIDVRTQNEYEENHLPHALSIPLATILKNPYVPNLNQAVPMLLYCKHGYNSEIAANCLVEAGYEKVYYFGLSDE